MSSLPSSHAGGNKKSARFVGVDDDQTDLETELYPKSLRETIRDIQRFSIVESIDRRIYVNPPRPFLENVIQWLFNVHLSFINKTVFLARVLNHQLIAWFCNTADHRPYALSTEFDYTNWDSLTDLSFNGRHLPPKPREYPDIDKVIEKLFVRPRDKETLDLTSTVLFPAFAQYITDGFVRTRTDRVMRDGYVVERTNFKKNTGTHQIDLCQLYGRTRQQTDALRLKSNKRGEKGRLKSQIVNGEEYGPFLYDRHGKLKPEFEVLDPPFTLGHMLLQLDKDGDDEKKHRILTNLFAFGGDRTNVIPQVAAVNTLFLREHNRIAGIVQDEEPSWNDERVFQVARNILIVINLKIIVEEYITHIAKCGFDFRLEPGPWAWDAPFNKPNRITTEFSILYRWHSLIPSVLKFEDDFIPLSAAHFENMLLMERDSLRDQFIDMSSQRCASFCPFNTSAELIMLEKGALNASRFNHIGPFADYCEYLGRKRPTSFEDISRKPEVVQALQELYETVDDVEFYVGLIAEDHFINNPFGGTTSRLVGFDAFSQLLTNPLVSRNAWKEDTFGSYGWKAVNDKHTLKDLVERNTPGGPIQEHVGMTVPDFKLKWKAD